MAALDPRTDYMAMVVNDEMTLDLAEQLAAHRCTTCLMGLPCKGRERWERIAARLRKEQNDAAKSLNNKADRNPSMT